MSGPTRTAPARLLHLARAAGEPAPDADLVARFVRTCDEGAFAALVERHGPMVLGVCRRVLGDPHAAEDAFQAAFLALARNAARVRDPRAVAAWLYGAAVRVALKARRAAARAGAARPPAPARPAGDPLAEITGRELAAAIDEELARLPERLRTPVILCCLDGLSQADAGRRLGWSAGSVKGRLERGRERLRKRLARRGITLSATLALIAAADGTAVAPPGLFEKAVHLAVVGPASPVLEGLARAGAGTRVVPTAAAITVLAVAVGLVGTLSRGQLPTPSAEPDPRPAARASRVDRFGDPLPADAVARLGTVRYNHGDGLRRLLYLPDGKTIVSVGNGWARLWDAETGVEVRQFPVAGTSWKDEVVISPDGHTLIHLQQGESDPLGMYDLATGRAVRTWSLPSHRFGLAYSYLRSGLSPDGRLALVYTPRGRRVFDMHTGKELCRIGPDFPVRRGGAFVHPNEEAVAFAGPDQVVTLVRDGPIEVWEARTGKWLRSFPLDGPAGVLVPSPDGKLLATLARRPDPIGKFDNWDIAQVWDLTTGKLVRWWEAPPESLYHGVAFAPDGRTVVTAMSSAVNGWLTRWEVRTGRRMWEVNHDGSDLLAVSPDGKRLATGMAPGRLTIWDLETGRLVAPEEPYPDWAADLHLSRTGDRVVTVGYRSVSTWDGATGRRLQSFPLPYVNVVEAWRVVSPRGRYAATLSRDGERTMLHVFDVAGGGELIRRPVGVTTGGVRVAFTPDESRVAVRLPGAEASTIHILDVPSGMEALTIRDPRTKWPGNLSVTPDGATLVAAGHRVVGYSLTDGAEQFSYTINPDPAGGPVSDNPAGWRALALSADGTLGCCVLSRGIGGPSTIPDRLLVFDGRTGRALHRWSDSGKGGTTYEVVAFSPDGRLVASSDGYDVHLWESATAREVRTFRGHRGEIEALAFSGNGRRLASASWDSTVLVWDLSASPGGGPADWWTDLASDDAATAWAAVWRLADADDDITIPLLRQHLRPVTAAENERMRELVANLDSDEFRTREQAFQGLLALGHAARPALTAARERKPSAESAGRMERLLAKVVGPPSSGESLRTSRVLAVLEAKATPAAADLLRKLAAGADGWLTAQAQTAVKRLPPYSFAASRGAAAGSESGGRDSSSGGWARASAAPRRTAKKESGVEAAALQRCGVRRSRRRFLSSSRSPHELWRTSGRPFTWDWWGGPRRDSAR